MSRVVQPCGTKAAYRRHLAHHQIPCGACLAARRHRRRLATQARATQMNALWTELLDLISAECRNAGMLP